MMFAGDPEKVNEGSVSLFDLPPSPSPRPEFDGDTHNPKMDCARLTTQLDRVREAMQDGVYRTLAELSALTPGSEASLSARLRDLRKPRFGGHAVHRRRRVGQHGTHEYRLVLANAKGGA